MHDRRPTRLRASASQRGRALDRQALWFAAVLATLLTLGVGVVGLVASLALHYVVRPLQGLWWELLPWLAGR